MIPRGSASGLFIEFKKNYSVFAATNPWDESSYPINKFNFTPEELKEIQQDENGNFVLGNKYSKTYLNSNKITFRLRIFYSFIHGKETNN